MLEAQKSYKVKKQLQSDLKETRDSYKVTEKAEKRYSVQKTQKTTTMLQK